MSYQGKAWVYIANTKDKTYETTKFVKEKTSETATTTKEPLTLDVHHVKIQKQYNTNPDVYLVFNFFCTIK
jgi:hypothetical protein